MSSVQKVQIGFSIYPELSHISMTVPELPELIKLLYMGTKRITFE